MASALQRLLGFYRLQVRLVRTWRLGTVALIRRFAVTNVVALVALAATIAIVPGISVSNELGIVLGVFVIVLINTMVRPVVLAVVIPLGILAVLLVGTAVQVAAVLLLGSLVPGLHVRGLAPAVEGALLFAILNTAIGWFIALGEDDSYFGHLVRLLIRERSTKPGTDVPGVVFVQIDGLSHAVLLHEIRAGRAPTMSRWLRSGTHRLDRWECQLPSQTSASQAGILLGSNDGIPAFRWFEKATGRLMVSNRAPDAAEIERRLANGDGLLIDGGTSIGNLVSGEAPEAILTMSRLTDRVAALGPTRSWFYFLVSPFALGRAVFLTVGEIGKEIWQARRQRATGIEPRMDRGGTYPLLRAVTNVFLRQVSVALVMERILEGTPAIYVDFVDYDEIAHHAGPERGEALDALDGLDRALDTLARAAQEAPRPYRFVVLSDHGQSLGATFRQRYGVTLEALIARLIGDETRVAAATAPLEKWGPVNALLSEVSQGAGMSGRVVGRALRNRTRDGFVELGNRGHPGPASPNRAPSLPMPAGPDAGLPERAASPEFVVCASGNLALVYLDASRERMSLEEIEAAYPGLVESLAGHEGIGFILVRSKRFGALALGRSGCRYLDQDRAEGDDPLLPFGPDAVDDLCRLDLMSNVGDLVLNSRIDPETEEVAAFEELIGSHGGLGGRQTSAFILHPADWIVPGDRPLVGAPAVHRLFVRWLEDAGTRRPRAARGALPPAPASASPADEPADEPAAAPAPAAPAGIEAR